MATNGHQSKITIEPNVPVIVTLRYTSGKPVQSQFGGDQFLYSCHEGPLYASPALAQAIDHAGAGIDDQIEIIKRERRIGQQRHTDWVVRRLGEPRPDYPTPARDEDAPPPPRTAAAPAAAQPAATPIPPMPADRPLNQREELTGRPAGIGNPLAQALCLAIDAALIAQAHGQQRGLALAWRTEDIRAMAATLYIESRNAR